MCVIETKFSETKGIFPQTLQLDKITLKKGSPAWAVANFKPSWIARN